MTSPNQNNESWVHRVLTERIEPAKEGEYPRLFFGSSEADGLREQLSRMEGYAWLLQRRLQNVPAQT